MTYHRDMTNVQPQAITLHQTAPWNHRLTNPYRTRYARVGNRYFKVEADLLNAPWFVYEIDENDDIHVLMADYDAHFVALVMTLNQARLAIALRLDGLSTEEISAAVDAAPRKGTGRNHPANVARRASCQG